MGRVPVTAEMLRDGKLDDTTVRQALALGLRRFDALAEWTLAGIEAALRSISTTLDRKPREVMRVYFTAPAGSPTSGDPAAGSGPEALNVVASQGLRAPIS